MDNSDKAAASHATLQRWLGSPLGEEAKHLLEPDADRLDERRLAPGAVQAGWSAAWRAIVSTVTPWELANALETAVRTGGVLTLPPGVTKTESETLHAVASGETKQDRVRALESRRGSKVACPACNLVLPSIQQGRLRSLRIATCDNCRRIIIETAF